MILNGRLGYMKTVHDGIILTDKCEGESSSDVIRKIKRAFGQGKSLKIGHAGTLDPFATGLLIILLGQGTKLSRYVMAGKKAYDATLELGIETDTLDPTGKIVQKSVVSHLSDQTILKKASRFVGNIRQTPPAYSAVKHNGIRSYKLARKGHKVELKERPVTVHSLDIVSVDLPLITLHIECSSGTYIRSIAADLGKELGPGAHLKSLRRTGVGTFLVDNAFPSREISGKEIGSLLTAGTIALSEAIPDMQKADIPASLAEKVRNGYCPKWDELGISSVDGDCHNEWLKLVNDGNLVAVLRIHQRGGNKNGDIGIERVFS